jgi:hypothetical protein
VLDHHDAIGAGGHRRAGHDFHRVPGAERDGLQGADSSLAGPYQPKDSKRLSSLGIGGTAGKSIARRPSKWRLIAIGKDGLG